MSGIKDDEGFVSKYWICETCAHLKGWTGPGYGVTVVRGLCGHCRVPFEKMLIPVVDFQRGDIKPVWD